jgi:hypothetical protein
MQIMYLQKNLEKIKEINRFKNKRYSLKFYVRSIINLINYGEQGS